MRWQVTMLCNRVLLVVRDLVGVAFNRGEGTDGDRLIGRPRAKASDFGDRHAARRRDDGADNRAAHPPLAWAHAAAQERLHLVGAARAELYGAADLAGGDLLAAARDDRVGGAQHAVGRPVEGAEKRPDRALAGQA